MKEQENTASTALRYTGYTLITAGILVAGLIVLEIFTFFNKPEENIIVQYMTTELSKTNFVELNENPIILKESGAFAVSVFLFALLVWTASSLSHRIIKSGLSILPKPPLKLCANEHNSNTVKNST
ncbi:hypothetical protein MNBD_GAMMA10-313 [hydrothermal vent metagenome]|uniref:Uncharacterized protein n=1 Tax=hydrothermal vent metagenome TaxID=652676 RepID=A0A3B0YL52_9ZZZZ